MAHVKPTCPKTLCPMDDLWTNAASSGDAVGCNAGAYTSTTKVSFPSRMLACPLSSAQQNPMGALFSVARALREMRPSPCHGFSTGAPAALHGQWGECYLQCSHVHPTVQEFLGRFAQYWARGDDITVPSPWSQPCPFGSSHHTTPVPNYIERPFAL